MNALQRSFFDEPAPSVRRDLVIEAGAGTGKTTAIVREVLELLASDPGLNPEKIVLITFTEKAAGELADRLRSAVFDLILHLDDEVTGWPAGSANPIFVLPPERKSAFREVFEGHPERVEKLRSQTIHSFCQGILRSYPLQAGLDPDFSIVHGHNLTQRYRSLFEKWVETELRSPSAECQAEWETLFGRFLKLDNIRTTLITFFSRRELLEDDRLLIGGLEIIEPGMRTAVAELAATPGPELAKADRHLTSIVEYFRSHTPPEGLNCVKWIEYFAPVAFHLDKTPLKGNRSYIPALKFLKNGVANGKATIHERLTCHHAAGILLRVVRRFVVFLEEQKRKEGIVDFDDLLIRTRRLLADPTILRELRRRFQIFFVDEFQDTDRVQAEIVDLLARDEEGILGAGRVTIVGDPKQSIYSFRRADPETYNALVQQLLASGAEHRQLQDQYRSDPVLVRNLNALFTRLFSDESTENVFRPNYSTLTPRLKGSDSEEARIEFIAADALPEKAADERAAEAMAMVSFLLDARERGVKGGNIAILFRRLTKLDVYLDHFDRFGIPYALGPVTRLLDSRPVTDLLAVLRAMVTPFDLAAVLAAARSPYFGLSDDEMVSKWIGDAAPALTEVEAKLERLRLLAQERSVLEIIDLLVEASQISELHSLLSGTQRLDDQIDRFRELAAEFDARSAGGLRGFVTEMIRRKVEQEDGESPAPEATEDAVRIMSIHASKGLEFGTVILPDLGSAPVNEVGVSMFTTVSPPRLVITGKAMNTLDADFLDTGDGDSPVAVLKARREAETQRLFYVAVTRAKDKVVFVRNVGKGPDKSRSNFWPSIERIFGFDQAEYAGWLSESVDDTRDLPVGDQLVRVRFRKLEASTEERRTPQFVSDRVVELLNQEAVREQIFLPEPQPGLSTAEAMARAAGRRNLPSGLLLHRFFEVWDEQSDPEELLQRLSREQGCDAATTSRVQTRLSSALASPELKQLMRWKTIERELPLFVRGETGAATELRIDRLLEDDQGLPVVVDYKSGKPDPERLTRESEQIRRYCAAITRLTSQPCRGFLLYLDDASVDLVSVEV